jgi:hypothetical protein
MDDYNWIDGPLEQEPRGRADIEPRRERTDIRIKMQALPLKGEVEAHTDGPGAAEATHAITLLVLVVAACIPAVLATVVLALSHVPGLTFALTVVGVFAVMFAVCIVLNLYMASAARKHHGSRPSLTRPWARELQNGGHPNGQGASANQGHGARRNSKASAAGQQDGAPGKGREARSKQRAR